MDAETKQVLLGRQPIFDRELEAHAYELLYRSSMENHANDIENENQATSQVLVNTFTEFGLENVVGDNLAFVNLTKDFLVGKTPLPLPTDKVVLEVMENVEIDDELVAGVAELSKQGFSIALDDYVSSDRWQPLLKYANYIKMEVSVMSDAQIEYELEQLRPYNVKLVAEKIETEMQYQSLHDMGFDLFQGHFLEKPIVLHGETIPGNRMAILRLLSELYDKDITMDKLGDLVAQDVSMSYRILRYVNSAFFALNRQMESIQDAIVYVGLKNIRAWASMIAMSNFTDRPGELMQMAMVRARMCEQLAEATDKDDLASYFAVGLLSMLGSLLGQPMLVILNELPLAEDLKAALLHEEGDLGQALQCTVAYEHADWPKVRFKPLKPTQICDIYLEAVSWAEQSTKQLLSGDQPE